MPLSRLRQTYSALEENHLQPPLDLALNLHLSQCTMANKDNIECQGTMPSLGFMGNLGPLATLGIMGPIGLMHLTGNKGPTFSQEASQEARQEASLEGSQEASQEPSQEASQEPSLDLNLGPMAKLTHRYEVLQIHMEVFD